MEVVSVGLIGGEGKHTLQYIQLVNKMGGEGFSLF